MRHISNRTMLFIKWHFIIKMAGVKNKSTSTIIRRKISATNIWAATPNDQTIWSICFGFVFNYCIEMLALFHTRSIPMQNIVKLIDFLIN